MAAASSRLLSLVSRNSSRFETMPLRRATSPLIVDAAGNHCSSRMWEGCASADTPQQYLVVVIGCPRLSHAASSGLRPYIWVRAFLPTFRLHMSKIIACTTCSTDWQPFLADPKKHWREGYSAKSLADRWEAVDGFPKEVAKALESSPDDRLHDARPYYAVPEYKTDLPGGERPSQTDLLVLGRAKGGAFAMAVEGKVDESFGPQLGKWNDGTKGKGKRWKFLCDTLELKKKQPKSLRYQLFHRAVSAVLAARQHHAHLAILAVQSFSAKDTGLSDFEAFCQLFGSVPAKDSIVLLTTLGKTKLYGGWLSSG